MSRKVFVTRPAPAGHRSAVEIARVGWDAVATSTTRLVELDTADYPTLPRACDAEELALLIVTSANAARFFCRRLQALSGAKESESGRGAARILERLRSSGLPMAVVGEHTAAACLEYLGAPPALVAEQANQDALATAIVDRGIARSGALVLMPCAREVSPKLRERLQSVGMRVFMAPIYSSEPDPEGIAHLLESLARLVDNGEHPWVAVYAPSQLYALLDGARETGKEAVMASVRWAAIGPTTAEAIERRLQRPPHAVAPKPDDASLAAAMKAASGGTR